MHHNMDLKQHLKPAMEIFFGPKSVGQPVALLFVAAKYGSMGATRPRRKGVNGRM